MKYKLKLIDTSHYIIEKKNNANLVAYNGYLDG